MKFTTLILLTSLTVISSNTTRADEIKNNLPPSGPYQSVNSPAMTHDAMDMLNGKKSVKTPGESSPSTAQADRNMHDKNSGQMSEWMNRRQAQMESWMRQQDDRKQAEWRALKSQQAVVPQWVKQQQAQMEQRMRHQNMLRQQGWNNPSVMQRNQNKQSAMPGHRQNPNLSRQQQYFPDARGPVFGPGIPPPGFNNMPGNQLPQYRNTYPNNMPGNQMPQ